MDIVDSPHGQPAGLSLKHRIWTLARDLGELASDHLELVALEARQAGEALTRILSAAVVVSILVVSAWLVLVAAGIVWATDSGISWPVALISGGVLNIVIAGIVVYWIRSQVGELLFAATLRQLRRTADKAKAEIS